MINENCCLYHRLDSCIYLTKKEETNKRTQWKPTIQGKNEKLPIISPFKQMNTIIITIITQTNKLANQVIKKESCSITRQQRRAIIKDHLKIRKNFDQIHIITTKPPPTHRHTSIATSSKYYWVSTKGRGSDNGCSLLCRNTGHTSIHT